MDKKKLRICIDLDGTICEIRKNGQSYSDVKVKPGAREKINSLRAEGHTIIINTARNMATTGHNVGKVVRNVGKITLDWLEENNIEYDEIFFGKPNADITIDDRVLRFNDDWDDISENKLIELAKSK
ncbi:capsular biosynthesis protein [Gilliamella apicola]|uniref:Capsular biosynthesis protein n=1 Tax=Gilliamella apicola TaxID=1196095 RepID=A0A2V4EG68_9GAMM|nr:HAD hydrolase family protein [Gilliamella apicola]PXZ07247.1 capsular biosynthesis protein [Gilliamella apicola]